MIMHHLEFALPADVRVDREKGIVHGVIVAELGVFKDGRGEFTMDSLKALVEVANKVMGQKSRFNHSKEAGAHLGVPTNYRLDGNVVRADLHLSEMAKVSPVFGDLWTYVMDVADKDPNALEASLNVRPKIVPKRDANGIRLLGEDGRPAPPIWIPTFIRGFDLVGDGAATTRLLGNDDSVIDEPEEEDEMSAEQLAQLETQVKELTAAQTKQTEALSALAQSLIDDRKERQQAAQKSSREKQIVALCKHGGCEKLAHDFIADESLSVSDVLLKLFHKKCQEKQLVAEDGGGDTEQLSDKQKAAKEFAKHSDMHEALGVTPEDLESLSFESDGSLVVDITKEPAKQEEATAA